MKKKEKITMKKPVSNEDILNYFNALTKLYADTKPTVFQLNKKLNKQSEKNEEKKLKFYKQSHFMSSNNQMSEMGVLLPDYFSENLFEPIHRFLAPFSTYIVEKLVENKKTTNATTAKDAICTYLKALYDIAIHFKNHDLLAENTTKQAFVNVQYKMAGFCTKAFGEFRKTIKQAKRQNFLKSFTGLIDVSNRLNKEIVISKAYSRHDVKKVFFSQAEELGKNFLESCATGKLKRGEELEKCKELEQPEAKVLGNFYEKLPVMSRSEPTLRHKKFLQKKFIFFKNKVRGIEQKQLLKTLRPYTPYLALYNSLALELKTDLVFQQFFPKSSFLSLLQDMLAYQKVIPTRHLGQPDKEKFELAFTDYLKGLKNIFICKQQSLATITSEKNEKQVKKQLTFFYNNQALHHFVSFCNKVRKLQDVGYNFTSYIESVIDRFSFIYDLTRDPSQAYGGIEHIDASVYVVFRADKVEVKKCNEKAYHYSLKFVWNSSGKLGVTTVIYSSLIKLESVAGQWMKSKDRIGEFIKASSEICCPLKPLSKSPQGKLIKELGFKFRLLEGEDPFSSLPGNNNNYN